MVLRGVLTPGWARREVGIGSKSVGRKSVKWYFVLCVRILVEDTLRIRRGMCSAGSLILCWTTEVGCIGGHGAPKGWQVMVGIPVSGKGLTRHGRSALWCVGGEPMVRWEGNILLISVGLGKIKRV